MKGLSIKKLAAVGIGAALVGTALAPMVSAALSLQKSDIYGASGSPNVSIIVGSDAQVSDGVWAGNIAAKIAEKATMTKTVSVSGSPGEGGGSDASVSGLSVDLTIGGTVSYGAGSKQYKINLNSTAGRSEVDAANDTNALTNAQLPHLYNQSLSQKVNGVTTTPTIQEKIGVEVDAKFDKVDHKDLVAFINNSKFYYEAKLGSTGIDLNGTTFSDSGSDDAVKIILFGEQYSLSSATLSGTKYLKMVKTSAKESYNEGETITGLVGAGLYDGQDVTVKLVQITQAGAAAATYSATFELYDSSGTKIDTQTIAANANLKDSFVDSNDDYSLQSNLYVDTIAVGATTASGYVEVTKGTDTVEMYDTKGYPYDSTDTSGIYDYTVTITTSGNYLQKIKVQNSRDTWNNSSTGNGPLFPTAAGQSLTGNTGNSAVFGQSLADGTLGKGYASVEYYGFEANQEKTVIEFGQNVTGLDSTAAAGGLAFRGADDTSHNLPFYLKVNNPGLSGSSFLFDTKTIWYKIDDGTQSSNTDLNITVAEGDYVNGVAWTTIDYNGSYGNFEDLNITTTDGILDTNSFFGGNSADTRISIGDVNYTILGAASDRVFIKPDAWIEFRQQGSTGTLINNVSGDEADETYGKLLYNFNVVHDVNVTANNINLKGNGERIFNYAFKDPRDANTSIPDVYLMLDNQQLGGAAEGYLIQNNKAISYLGTAIPANDGTYTETWDRDLSAFIPKTSDFNTLANVYTDPNAYLISTFIVDDEVSLGDFNVYVDNSDGGNVGPFTNSNLTFFTKDVDYNGTQLSWNLQSGTVSNYIQAAYTDAGTKVELLDDDAGVKLTIPENLEQSILYVLGTEVATTASGEQISILDGETGITSVGTTIMVDAINYTASCSGGSGAAGTCTATPTTYQAPAPVSRLIHLDVDNVTGKKIIVGGPIVNSVAASVSGLADRLTAAGDTVAEVAASGDIIIAGYNAGDTQRAAQDLINAIDNL
ncbi:MAG: S-layer protein [Candidatus Diapherotrites archaeon]